MCNVFTAVAVYTAHTSTTTAAVNTTASTTHVQQTPYLLITFPSLLINVL